MAEINDADKRKLLLKYAGGEQPKYWSEIGYEDIIRAAIELRYGVVADIVVKEDEGSYQGSTLIICEDGKQRYYYYLYGWGSCSGCDVLQASEGKEEALISDYTPVQLKDARSTIEYMIKELPMLS